MSVRAGNLVKIDDVKLRDDPSLTLAIGLAQQAT